MSERRTFTEQDSEKLVKYLNFVATNAEFNHMTITKMIEFVRLLNWAQTDLLPKVESNIFEVLGVKQATPEEAPKKKGK